MAEHEKESEGTKRDPRERESESESERGVRARRNCRKKGEVG
jgi:hypothetical protein